MALLATSAGIGIAAGLVVALIGQITRSLHQLLFNLPSDARLSAQARSLLLALIPAVGGLLVGLSMVLSRRFRARPPVKLASNSAVGTYTYPVQGSTAFQPHGAGSRQMEFYLRPQRHQTARAIAEIADRTIAYDNNNRPVLVTLGSSSTATTCNRCTVAPSPFSTARSGATPAMASSGPTSGRACR